MCTMKLLGRILLSGIRLCAFVLMILSAVPADRWPTSVSEAWSDLIRMVLVLGLLGLVILLFFGLLFVSEAFGFGIHAKYPSVHEDNAAALFVVVTITFLMVVFLAHDAESALIGIAFVVSVGLLCYRRIALAIVVFLVLFGIAVALGNVHHG